MGVARLGRKEKLNPVSAKLSFSGHQSLHSNLDYIGVEDELRKGGMEGWREGGRVETGRRLEVSGGLGGDGGWVRVEETD